MNLTFFLPIYGALKPFDFLAVIIFAIAVVSGKRIVFFKYDFLFFVFFVLSLLSSLLATDAMNSSILQSLRYFFFFVVARVSWNKQEIFMIIRGLKIGISIVFAWIIIDIAQYLIVLDCMSLTEKVFSWVEYLPTHKSPIFVGGCLMFRPAGFAWDPGGFYPMLLFALSALFLRTRFRILTIFSIVALSKTSILAVLTSKIFPYPRLFNVMFLFILLFAIMPTIGLNLFSVLDLDLSAGFYRHLAYPQLAFQSIVVDPSLIFLGEGLRGSAVALDWVSKDYFTTFYNHASTGNSSILVVESIWVNQLLGAGLIGFVSYVLWMITYLRQYRRPLILLIVAGTFYTFDSSQFCYLVPFLMYVYRNEDAQCNKL